MQNPWKGLSTYTVEDNDNFVGREKEIRELCSLIENNLITTLYGKSGIGKSSLLNAGITPELSLAGYTILHVNIRDVKNTSNDFISGIAQSVSMLLNKKDDVESDISLWEIFHQKHLEEENIYPIIIFDQFEELFSGLAEEQVNNFILQIAELKLGRSKTKENDATEYTQNNNFRVVLSMREDDLYKLEDCIDKHGLYSLKDNRFRLRSLSKDGVRSIVEIGKEYFNDIDKCSNSIWEQLKDNNGNVDSATLSLLCYRLFEKVRNSPNTIITEHDIKEEKDPLYNLYKEEVYSLSRKEQIFIETNLISASGRRDITSLREFKSSIYCADKLLENSNYHFSLFRVVDEGKNVELLHDSLAKAVYKYKKSRNEKLERILQNLKTISVNLLLLCIPIIPILWGYSRYFITNSESTLTRFYTITAWPIIILLVPIFICIFVLKERRLRYVIPIAVLSFLMSINAGILNCWFRIDLSNIIPYFYHNANLQVILYLCFLIYSCFLVNTKRKYLRLFYVLYINILTMVCLYFGFGYNMFKVNNVVTKPNASIPWAYSIIQENNKYGYVDWDGNQIIPCKFDELIRNGNVLILVRNVRNLNIKNEGLLCYIQKSQTEPPLYYYNSRLYTEFYPHYENQIKNFSKSKIEEVLASKILTKGRLRIIESFENRKLLYNKELSSDINKLFTLHKDSLYNLLSLINSKDKIITDEVVTDIRTRLCKSICTLHLLESFGKNENITDDDIAHAITTLKYFSIFELMDERLEGFPLNFNTTFNLELGINELHLKNTEFSSFSLAGINAKNAYDIYSAFNSLYAYDLGVHQVDFRKFLESANESAIQVYNDILGISNQQEKLNTEVSDIKAKVIQNAASILANNNDLKSAINTNRNLQNLKNQAEDVTRRLNELVSKSMTVTERQLFNHNADLFNYREVIKPLIKCIAENDIPDQSTALTDITCRLMVMGMFRGLDMHDYIIELNEAYRKSQERTIYKTFEMVTKVDSMEYKYRQIAKDFNSRLKKAYNRPK